MTPIPDFDRCPDTLFDHRRDMTSIAFIGAGSVEFTRDLLADLLSFDELSDVEVRLHDIDPDRLATAEGIAQAVASQLGATPKVSVHPDRRAALEGVDFAINMIQVGGLAATKTDFAVPNHRGLRQTIADTLGIGGIFRALRTFPVLDGIAADMLEVCPDAWLAQLHQPDGMNVTYLARVAPELKMVGLCHSVYWTVHGLCELRRRAVGRGELFLGRRQPPGLAAALGARRQEPLPAARRAHRRRPAAAAAGPRRHVPATGLLPDRDERALLRVRALVSQARRRDRTAAHRARRLRGHQ